MPAPWETEAVEAPPWETAAAEIPPWEQEEDVPTSFAPPPPAFNLAPQFNYLPGGMNDPGTGKEFLAEVANDPYGFIKSIPESLLGAVTAPGKLAYQTAADVVSKVAGQPEYGGNLEAGMEGRDLPVETFLSEVSKTNPKLAVTGKIGKSLAEIAPLAGVAALPAWAARLISGGFTAQMISHAPEQFEAFADEYFKSPQEQDPDKMTTLWSDVIQTGVFAPLAGRHAIGERAITPGDFNRIAGRELNRSTSRAVELPDLTQREAQSRLGVRIPEGPFSNPGVKELADAALREAQQKVIVPGREGEALNELRQAVEPTQLTQVEPTRIAERIEGAGEAPYGKTSFMREAEAPTTERTQAVTAAEKSMLQKFVDEETAQGAVFEQKNLPEGVSYRRPSNAPTPEEYQKRLAKESADQGLTQESGFYLDEPARQSLPESTPPPERVREGVSIVSPGTGRAIEKPIPLSALQRSRLRAALARGASEETIKNILRLEAPENPQIKETGGAKSDPLTATVSGEPSLMPTPGAAVLETGGIVSKLESLKFKSDKNGKVIPDDPGQVFSLPHPDAVKQIGKQLWNDSIDLALGAIRAGKSAKEAIETALRHVRFNASRFNENQLRANLASVIGDEAKPKAATASAAPPPTIAAATHAVTDPITGQPAKLITEKAARAMESKVKIPAQADVSKLTEQLSLFTKEIGDALETGGQFLAKDLRPAVAKGAPAERGTVTSKEVNQYFVNKLSSIRKQMQATRQKIGQQADVESGVYFDLLQQRFEHAFRQVQELRRASHESLYFWNRIKAEYQDIARAAGEMPEMKRQLPVLDQIWKDFRDKKPGQAGKHAVDYLRMNLFTMGSWTLDFGTNLAATATKLPVWAIMDAGSLVSGIPATRMFTAMRALADNTSNWNPLAKRFRLSEQIESELGNTAGGEFGGKGREVIVDFSEILKAHPELADKLRHIDKVIGAPVRMKRAVDGFFGRFGATAELYHRAYTEGKSRGLNGDELKTFVEDFIQKPSESAVASAVKKGKELKFNRDLTKWEEAYANNIITKLVVEAFPRWTLQFIRWGGEMIGANPVFLKDLATGKATAEQSVNYLVKAATGWGGIYAFNSMFYDNIDANSMEYVKEDGDRVRLAGRTPAPELFFIVAMLRGDTEKAKAALAHLSVPGAKLLSGEPAGLISPLVDTIRESIRGRYTKEQTIRELTKLVNDAIPGKSVLGLIRSIFDPSVREGIGSPIPGVSSLLPQRVNPTTGEPLVPKQKIPGTSIEIPTVAGTPFPGAVRVLNDIESTLLNHGLGNIRPRRTSIIDFPAEDVPKDVRREYEKLVGGHVKQLVGDLIKTEEFKSLPFDVRRQVLSEFLEASRRVAKYELAQKYGTGMKPVKSTPLNIERLPKRLRE